MKKILGLLFFLTSAALYAQVNPYSAEKVDQSVEKGATVHALVNVYDESIPMTLPLDGINFLGSSVTCVRTAHGSTFLADCTFTGGGGGGGDVSTDGIWAAAGDIVYGTGVSTATRLAKGTANQLLHSGNAPTWSAVDLAADVTGLLPLANFSDGSALSLLGRTANSSGVMAPLQCTAAGGGIFRESGSILVCSVLSAASDGGAIVKQASAPGTVQGAAFWNIDGLGTVTKNDIKTTTTDGLFLSNTTASDAVNTVQYSPTLRMCGGGWNSSGAVNNTDCWRIYAKPVTAAGTTSVNVVMDSSVNGGAFANKSILTSNGSLSVTGSMTAGTSILATAGDITIQTTTNRLLWGNAGNVGGFANDATTDGAFRVETAAGIASSSQLTAGTYRVQGLNFQRTIQSTTAEALAVAGATTKVSTIQLPAGSIIEAIGYRITVAVTGATSFTIGDSAGNVGRFCGTQGTMTLGTTGICLAHRQPSVSDAMGPVQNAADTVLITFNSAATGTIRVVIYYTQFTAPTS